MATRTTEDAIKQFKAFVKRHPDIVKTVKAKQKPWKDVFEEWVLFGEDNEIWKDYGVEEIKPSETDDDGRSKDSFSKFLNFVSTLDPESVQKHLDQLDGALNNLQDIIGQLQPKRSYQYLPGHPQNRMAPPAYNQPHSMYKKD